MTTLTRVYRPVPEEGFEWALPLEDASFEVIRRAQPDTARWAAPAMRLLHVDDDGTLLHWADMPWHGSHVLVLGDEAVDRVGPLLSAHGVCLPLTCDEARMAVFVARALVGGLDEDRSELVRFGSGRILDLKRPAFIASAIAQSAAFRLEEMLRGDLYLTDRIVDAIRATGLSGGTEFELVEQAD